MTIEQCTECDKKKGECKCEKPTFTIFLNKKDHKTIQNKSQTKKEIKKVKGRLGKHYFESILADGKPVFLCNINDSLKLAEKFEVNNTIYKPIEAAECGYFPYNFTKLYFDLLKNNPPTKEELLDEIKAKIDYFIDIIERDKHLILADLFLSYCQEWVDTLHFPFFVGETESGKSTALHLFRWLGYRCLYGEDIPNADIYNFLGTDEEAAGTICEDEAQELNYSKEKIRTYKNSYSRGALKPRIIGNDNQKKQVFYKTFCLKLFAGEKTPEDKGFRERLAIVHMTEGTPKGNIKRMTKEEKESLQSLRNKLLIWKVININKGLDRSPSKLVKRDQELWEDFLSVMKNTKYYQTCNDVVKYYTKQRHEAIWNSIEAGIFKLLIQKINEESRIHLESFWNYLCFEQEEISGDLDKQTFLPHDYSKKITRNFLSRLFEDKFQAKRTTKYEVIEGKKHLKTEYLFDLDILQRLVTKYNVSISIDNLILCGRSGGSG